MPSMFTPNQDRLVMMLPKMAMAIRPLLADVAAPAGSAG